MLRYLASAVLFLFALLFACKPGGELLEPIPSPESDQPVTTEVPPATTPPLNLDSAAKLALHSVNTFRFKGCECGGESLPPASEVNWNTELYTAALAHAKDMRTNNYFSHTNPAGENVYHRLINAGYIGTSTEIRSYGENIAFGNFDLTEVLQKWLASPSHCANIMRDTYQEMAIAHDGNYWVQVFGSKRN